MADDVVDHLKTRWSDEIELAPDLFAAQRAEVEVTGWRGFNLELRLELQAGRYRCTRLTVEQRPEGDEISGEGLRNIPVTGIIRAAIAQMVEQPDIPQVTKRLVNRIPTQETLLSVTRVYLLAAALELPPKREVARRFEIATSTAGNWIARARDAGLLPKA